MLRQSKALWVAILIRDICESTAETTTIYRETINFHLRFQSHDTMEN